MIKQVIILYCNSCERSSKGLLLPKGWERVGKDPSEGPYTAVEDQIHRCDECTALVRLPPEKMREFLQISAVRRFLGLGSCEDDSGEKEGEKPIHNAKDAAASSSSSYKWEGDKT